MTASRADGRDSNSLRPTSIQQGLLARADGSAQFSISDDVAVLCSVTGPTEVKIRDELLDRATLEVNVVPLRGQPSPWTKSVAATLKQILSSLVQLHTHPRSLIQITLQTVAAPDLKYSRPFRTFNAFAEEADEVDVLDDRPSANECAAFLNATILACLDAGLSMNGIATATSLAFVDGKLITDPTPLETRNAAISMVGAFAYGQEFGGSGGVPIWFETIKGEIGLDDEQIEAATLLAQQSCSELVGRFRQSIQKHLLPEDFDEDGDQPKMEVESD